MSKLKKNVIIIWLSLAMVLLGSCKKLIEIDEPKDSITMPKMFRTDQLAEAALLGVYNSMVHGPAKDDYSITPAQAYTRAFAGGLSTYAGGLCGGELLAAYNTRNLADQNKFFSYNYWYSAYNVIYLANSVIEGIAASDSPNLTAKARKQFTSEAKLLRAFSYLYLVQYFGDVPLVLTIDFNTTKNMARTETDKVYEQILADLLAAYADLPEDYPTNNHQRIRVNKWTAAAILARVYLYLGRNEEAAEYASVLIDKAGIYHLEPLEKVFMADSREAIFQLLQTTADGELRNATAEGYYFLPNPAREGMASVYFTSLSLNSFEKGDQRRVVWVDSTRQTIFGGKPNIVFYPAKYKMGREQSELGLAAPENTLVLRLAEQYLIRAEARANGAKGGTMGAIDDLNRVRERAGLKALSQTLSPEQVKAALWQERKVELMAEWGHRWIDLRRSGLATQELSKLPLNQPWLGNYQLLFPIPPDEIRVNKNLIQNPGYTQLF